MTYLVSNWYFEILQALKMFQQCSGTTLQAPIGTPNSVSKVSCISGQYAKHFHHIRMEIHCKKLLFLQEKTTLQTERAVKWTLIALKPLPSEHHSHRPLGADWNGGERKGSPGVPDAVPVHGTHPCRQDPTWPTWSGIPEEWIFLDMWTSKFGNGNVLVPSISFLDMLGAEEPENYLNCSPAIK